MPTRTLAHHVLNQQETLPITIPVFVAILGWWGGLEAACQVLLILMGIEMASGFFAQRTAAEGVHYTFAWKRFQLKALTLFVVVTASVIETYAPFINIPLRIPFGPLTAGAACGLEIIGILQNARTGSVDEGILGALSRVADLILSNTKTNPPLEGTHDSRPSRLP